MKAAASALNEFSLPFICVSWQRPNQRAATTVLRRSSPEKFCASSRRESLLRYDLFSFWSVAKHLIIFSELSFLLKKKGETKCNNYKLVLYLISLFISQFYFPDLSIGFWIIKQTAPSPGHMFKILNVSRQSVLYSHFISLSAHITQYLVALSAGKCDESKWKQRFPHTKVKYCTERSARKSLLPFVPR